MKLRSLVAGSESAPQNGPVGAVCYVATFSRVVLVVVVVLSLTLLFFTRFNIFPAFARVFPAIVHCPLEMGEAMPNDFSGSTHCKAITDL